MESPKEWLQTNGLGGFACGVDSGPPTRRYHGLLCASVNPPTDRWMLVSHLVEGVACGGQFHQISMEHYVHHRPENAIKPLCYSAFPYPKWTYEIEGNRLEKSLIMLAGEHTTLLRYRHQGAQPLTLTLKPLCALRGYHDLRDHTEGLAVDLEANQLRVECPGVPPVYMTVSRGAWGLLDTWYHQFFYAEEAHRGFPAQEELYCPAELTLTLSPGETLVLRLSTTPGIPKSSPFAALDENYHKVAEKSKLAFDIESAARNFLVHRQSTSGPTILAGYPWFTDWGRDTLISLRDFQSFLTPTQARQIIETFVQFEAEGLIPNRFPDCPNDPVEYNTADATLWLFVALWELHQLRPHKTFINKMLPTLERLIKAHLEGTRFNIKVLPDGLLFAGEAGQQLTWMDAKVGDYVVTPREGCAVEINLLWYNALQIFRALGGRSEVVNPWIKKFEQSFAARFWNPIAKGCYDVIHPEMGVDASVRPNQIYAVSLPFSPLSSLRQKHILQQVTSQLYTPFGLRTLSPESEAFKPTYDGGPMQRDEAYHQGTVWPFLLREYWVAYEKVWGRDKMQAALKKDFLVLQDHFYHADGLGGVSEIFDGAQPHQGKGCPWQAWSVAALWKMKQMLEA